LPELVLIEGIQQVAMKRGESLSPSLFFYDGNTVSAASWAQDLLEMVYGLKRS
jgi:hypothetical protein